MAYWKYSDDTGYEIDLVPVRVGSVGYLFDRVSGQLFGNSGTGDFVCGPDTFATGVLPTRMCVMGAHDALPYTREIEYLQSSGTQYINTGVLPSTGMQIGVKVQRTTNNSDWDGVIGAWSQDVEKNGIAIRYAGTQGTTMAPTYGGSIPKASRPSITAGSVVEAVLSQGSFSIGGVERATWTPDTSELPTAYPFFCFQCNLLGSPWNGRWLKGRIYYLWMLRDGKLVFDAIPVREGSTGYLYDRVTKQLFGNAGTGSFVLGPDK
jgi:hypothetical protein